MVNAPNPDGVQHVMTTGSQVVAHRDTIVRSIIQRDSLADVQSADLLSILHLSVLVQSSLKPRMSSGRNPFGPVKKTNGMIISGSLKSMKRPKARKEKGKDLSPKRGPRARILHGRLLQDLRSPHRRRETDPIPKPKPEARSCMTNDILFAMMTTKAKPTWRHSTWNGIDYMICTVAEPQKKLPVFKVGKWSTLADRRISLDGHDAKTMKNFTLHFHDNEQRDTLDRGWFGEMWFPVQRHTYHVHASVTDDSIADPADLDLDEGYSEPDLCFS